MKIVTAREHKLQMVLAMARRLKPRFVFDPEPGHFEFDLGIIIHDQVKYDHYLDKQLEKAFEIIEKSPELDRHTVFAFRISWGILDLLKEGAIEIFEDTQHEIPHTDLDWMNESILDQIENLEKGKN